MNCSGSNEPATFKMSKEPVIYKMSKKANLKTLLNCTVVAGCFFFKIPLGIDWYYGNLSTYTDSYFRIYVGEKAFDVQPNWLLSSYLIAYVLGILIKDLLAIKLKPHLILLVHFLLFDVGIFIGYFTVQRTVGLMLTTTMLFCGYSTGVITMVCFKYAHVVMPRHVGLGTAILGSGINAGAVINNYVITAYVNPYNLPPDILTDNKAYFSKAQILDNVPNLFIILGFLTCVPHVLGYLMTQGSFHFLNKWNKIEETDERTPIVSAAFKNDKSRQSTIIEENSEKELHKSKKSDVEKTQEAISLKPSEVLRMKSFYILCVCRMVLSYAQLVYYNYYKTIGQLWIPDDSFLASIGSFGSVSNGLFRVMSGWVVDHFGMKSTLISSLSLSAILTLFLYTTPSLNRWLYFFCCQGVVGIQGIFFILFPIATLKLYGPKYYATNYGLLMLAHLSTCLVCPFLFSFLQVNYGWYSLLLLGGALCTLTLILVVCLLTKE